MSDLISELVLKNLLERAEQCVNKDRVMVLHHAHFHVRLTELLQEWRKILQVLNIVHCLSDTLDNAERVVFELLTLVHVTITIERK